MAIDDRTGRDRPEPDAGSATTKRAASSRKRGAVKRVAPFPASGSDQSSVADSPAADVPDEGSQQATGAVERTQRIAEAAYLRAASRDFEPGHEVEDWLNAEREIDAEERPY